MLFRATNYTVGIVLLMALTLFVAGLRMRKPLDSNWPLLYWVLLTLISLRYPGETFQPKIIMVGLGAGLLLRFEFVGSLMANLLRTVEIGVWVYVLYTGFVLVTTA
jgi:hypothetical protein